MADSNQPMAPCDAPYLLRSGLQRSVPLRQAHRETSEPQKSEPDEAGSQAQQDAAETPDQLKKAAPIDPKKYRGRLQLDPLGRLWHGRYPLAPTLRAVSFEADQAAQVLPDPGVAVVPIVAVHGAQVPWGKVVADGVPVVAARRLPSMLRALPAVLGPSRSPI
jgi:hypothetical protein